MHVWVSVGDGGGRFAMITLNFPVALYFFRSFDIQCMCRDVFFHRYRPYACTHARGMCITMKLPHGEQLAGVRDTDPDGMRMDVSDHVDERCIYD